MTIIAAVIQKHLTISLIDMDYNNCMRITYNNNMVLKTRCLYVMIELNNVLINVSRILCVHGNA